MIKSVANSNFLVEKNILWQHISQVLEWGLEKFPNKEALVYLEDDKSGDNKRNRASWTFRDLASQSYSIAEQLFDLGIDRNSKVAIMFPNHPVYVAAFFAVALCDACIVPLNPLLKSEEIAHIITDSEAEIVIVHEKCFSELKKAEVKTANLRHVLIYAESQRVDKLAVSGNENEKDLLASAKQYYLKASKHIPNYSYAKIANFKKEKLNCNSSDIAMLVYTSGTTGKPKGAMLTHTNLLSIFPPQFGLYDITSQDTFLAILPMCHIYGITILVIGALACAAKLVMLSKFESKFALEIIENENITIVPAVPTMYQFMVLEAENRSSAYKTNSVRMCFCGGAPISLELMQKAQDLFKAPFIEGWGMTETACVASLNPLKGKLKAGSIGPAMPGVKIVIVDENDKELGPGKENIGELVVSGPNVMQGYFKQGKETDKRLRNGRFYTGDLGYYDEDDYYYLVGRKTDMIIRGGQNIYPREIENVILSMEEISEVAVLGIPDIYMGERVKAVIVPKEKVELSPEQVINFCVEKLADYKVPKVIEFKDALPKNSTGKVLKRLLV